MATMTVSGGLNAGAGANGNAEAGAGASAAFSVSGRTATPHRQPADPFTAFRFLVSFDHDDHTVIGGFADVTGLGVETEVETVREGGVNGAEQQLVGANKFASRLVLKRGMADKTHLWAWYRQILAGAIKRRDVRIEVLSTDGAERIVWTFLQACPVKWTGPELHAGTSAVAFESIELVHKGLLPD